MLKRIGDIIAVSIKENADEISELRVGEFSGNLMYCNKHGVGIVHKLPEGSWELIGLSHLLTSEQKEMVVEKCHGGYETYDKSIDFAKKNMRNYCKSVDDSYQSWLEANGIEENTVLLKRK